MLNVQSMILSQRVMALKSFIEDYISPWKSILETSVGDIGGNFILCCNFDTCKLPIYVPDFYIECLNAWSDINTSNSFPKDWKLIIKQSQQHVCPPSNHKIQINIESAAADVLEATSKMLNLQ